MDDSSPTKRTLRAVSSGKWAHWQSVLGEWKTSGQSPADFCARRSIPFSKFRWWRGHIEKRARPSRAASSKLTFLPLVVRGDAEGAEATKPDAPPLELVLRGGCVVRVPSGFDEASLVRLVAVLESARCG